MKQKRTAKNANYVFSSKLSEFLQKLPMNFIKTQNFCKKKKNLILLPKKLKDFAQKLKKIAEKLNGPVVSDT